MRNRRPVSSVNRDAEQGTTLAEVLVVLTLTAIVATPLFMVLQSAFRTERAQSQQIEADRQLALVADRFEIDVRSGRAAADRAGGVPSDHLAVLSINDDGSEELVVWLVDGDSLRRRASDASSGAVTSDVVLVDNVDATNPLFRYWEASGVEVAPVSVDRIVSCAVRVTIDLRSTAGGVQLQRVIDSTHRVGAGEEASC